MSTNFFHEGSANFGHYGPNKVENRWIKYNDAEVEEEKVFIVENEYGLMYSLDNEGHVILMEY